jgi:hypothetical protein
MMQYNLIREDKRSKVLIVTPLKTGHKVSSDTKKTIKRNDIPFTWVTSEGENNIPTNAWNGVQWYRKKSGKLPEYYLMIDRDIILGRHMIDRLHEKLSAMPSDIVYSYASFKFSGHIDKEFPATMWDINKLLLENYISSNSMFRMSALEEVGLVFDDKYKRLLDWAFLLKLFLKKGYIGVPCPEASFVAVASANSISSGSNEDYHTKRLRVIQDFAKPIIHQHAEKQKMVAEDNTLHLDF